MITVIAVLIALVMALLLGEGIYRTLKHFTKENN